MAWRDAAWLLAVVALTWHSMDASFPVEVQRQAHRGAWETIATDVRGMRYEDTVGEGRWCWRVRHLWPQETKWSKDVCVRVRD